MTRGLFNDQKSAMLTVLDFIPVIQPVHPSGVLQANARICREKSQQFKTWWIVHLSARAVKWICTGLWKQDPKHQRHWWWNCRVHQVLYQIGFSWCILPLFKSADNAGWGVIRSGILSTVMSGRDQAVVCFHQTKAVSYHLLRLACCTIQYVYIHCRLYGTPAHFRFLQPDINVLW